MELRQHESAVFLNRPQRLVVPIFADKPWNLRAWVLRPCTKSIPFKSCCRLAWALWQITLRDDSLESNEIRTWRGVSDCQLAHDGRRTQHSCHYEEKNDNHWGLNSQLQAERWGYRGNMCTVQPLWILVLFCELSSRWNWASSKENQQFESRLLRSFQRLTQCCRSILFSVATWRLGDPRLSEL